MTGAELGTLLLGVFGGAPVATLITILVSRKKINAEALHTKAQGEVAEVTAQSTVITDLQKHNKDLQDRLDRFQERLDKFEEAERTNALIMLNMTLWTHKAYAVMTEDQREKVGPPPLTDPKH